MLSLALISTAALASGTKPDLIWCHNCTGAQVNAAVLADTGALGSTIYVGDVVTGAVGAYQVYIDVDDGTKPHTRTRAVIGITPDPALLTDINGAIGFYQYAPVGWDKRIAIAYDGGDPFASGWTVADAGKEQNDLNQWFNSTYAGSRGLVTLWGYAISVWSSVNGSDPTSAPHGEVTVTFSDDSKITGVYDIASKSIKADPDTAVDAENNTIPYLGSEGKVHNLGGRRKFANTYDGDKDHENFVKQLQTLRVPLTIESDPGSTPGGSINPTICVETPSDEGPVITCYQG
jgi:hypothetical protein